MTTSNRSVLLLAAVLAGLAGGPARARAAPLFAADLTDGVQTVSVSFDNVTDALDMLRRSQLNALFKPTNPGFDPELSALVGTIHARGIAVYVQAPQGSSSITVRIPAIGLTKTFTGATRDESARLMREWFRTSHVAGGALARKSAELSPADPLAGNPYSAQARTVSTSFDRGFERIATMANATLGKGAKVEGTQQNGNAVFVGASYRSGGGPYRRQSYTLPIGYSWRFDDDYRHQISFDLPLTYQSVEGARLFGFGAGIGYSRPFGDYWVLTAGIDYGMAASRDLGSEGQLLTGTITSIVTLPLGHDYLLHLGNMLGYSRTVPLQLGNYDSNPEIANEVLRNGVMFYASTAGLWRSTGIELFAVDTRYFGARLFDQGYTELGVSFGKSTVTVAQGKRYDSVIRIGGSYLFARGNSGFTVNTGYLF